METSHRRGLKLDATSLRGSIKRAARRTGSLGLTLTATMGVVCIVCILASVLFKVSFVAFRTGSMSPAYPVGALAAVREVPASSLEPGDVATVQRRPGTIPITHRVVTVQPDSSSPGGAVLVLKGDANTSVDPVEYQVQSARVVLFAVPQLGTWVMGMRTSWAIGGTSVLLAGLVGWVFWPRRNTGTPGAGIVEGRQNDLDGTAPSGEVAGGSAALQ